MTNKTVVKKEKIKRCPNGTRRVGKECVKKNTAAVVVDATAPILAEIQEFIAPTPNPERIVEDAANMSAAITAPACGKGIARCARGTRCRSGVCVAPAAAPAPPVVAPVAEIPPHLDETKRPARAPRLRKRPAAATAAAQPPTPPILDTPPAAPAPPQAREPTPEEGESQENARQRKLRIERAEYEENRAPDPAFDFLYPHVNDPNFNTKIAAKKEFQDYKYDGAIYDIKTRADELCAAEFELSPHQLFVRNFMSFQTPYQSLLLYHGLGTGKTCSAIGITEEMREAMKQTGSTQKIIIVASPNVQANFQKELFNDARLTEKDGVWYLNTCIGAKLLKEINPTNIKHIPREKIVSQIHTLIRTYYVFMGYIEFSNYIHRHTQIAGVDDEKKRRYERQQLRRIFNGRMIVIDEVHNVRITEDNKKNKSIGMHLFHIARVCENVRMLLLTATPMYNHYTEIIWLTNLLNANDKRPLIKASDVFHLKTGEFRAAAADGGESGRELLLRKLTGYVSYVRGENPYTFPFRLYPRDFTTAEFYFRGGAAPEAGLLYPTRQMNGKEITEPLQFIQVYATKIHPTQERGYKEILESVNHLDEEAFQQKESFGYGEIQAPLEALNIIYPHDAAAAASDSAGDVRAVPHFTGKLGLSSVMTWEETGGSAPERKKFEYTRETLEKWGRFLSPEKVGEYSHKIADICRTIREGVGMIMVYSNNIDGGLVPLALALEEMGFSRFSTTVENCSLFKTPPPAGAAAAAAARYIMITGDKAFSKNNAEDLKYITSPANRSGERVKVVLISRAGFEGLDFKFIRQIHVMDSWYNMSRVEQTIGRAVRNLSHCALPFEERNVEIYLHGTILTDPTEEAIDLYLYRFAEKKARQIGRLTRVLKETAVDCLMHLGQTNFTVQKMRERAENQHVKIRTSTGGGREMEFRVGDKPLTELCDYMENCEFKCSARGPPAGAAPDARTFDEAFLETNKSMIMKRIRQLYLEQSTYSRRTLISNICQMRQYPIDQIFAALNAFLYENEYLTDKHGRTGTLMNRGEYYVFQPAEITDTTATVYERTAPVDMKREKLVLQTAPSAAAAHTEAAAAAAAEEDIMGEFHKNMDTYKTTRELPPKETDWYKHAAIIRAMTAEKLRIPATDIDEFVIHHMVDTYPHKVKLIERVRRGGAAAAGTLEEKIAQYVNQKYYIEASAGAGAVRGYFVNAGNVWTIYVIESDGTLQPALDSDVAELEAAVNQKFKFARTSYNKIVGFINLRDEKSPDGELVFRIKKMDQKKNNKGNYCANGSGKGDLVREINEILGGDFVEDLKQVVKPSYCCLAEFILRYFMKTRKDGRVWFLTPEEAAKNRIKDI